MASEIEPSSGWRVLVVDDNVDVARALSGLLQLMGCKTVIAFGSVMACRIAQLFKPNVVIVDFALAGEDACTVLRLLMRCEPSISRALRICMSGRPEPDLRQRSLEAGFDHFIAKPIEGPLLGQLLLGPGAAPSGG